MGRGTIPFKRFIYVAAAIFAVVVVLLVITSSAIVLLDFIESKQKEAEIRHTKWLCELAYEMVLDENPNATLPTNEEEAVEILSHVAQCGIARKYLREQGRDSEILRIDSYEWEDRVRAYRAVLAGRDAYGSKK